MESRKSGKLRTVSVALLRGINVGGGNILSMAELRTGFERLGYEDVRTYINSGNVMFSHQAEEPRETEKRIEHCIAKEFDMDIKVVVRTAREIAVICRKIPATWANDSTMKTDVLFLRHDIDAPKVLSEIATNPEVDTLIYAKGAVIWHISRDGSPRSGMRKFIGTHVYRNMTARNVNTVRKLHSLMFPSA